MKLLKFIIAIVLILALVLLVVHFVGKENPVVTPEPSPTAVASPSPYSTKTIAEINALPTSDVVIECNDHIFCLSDCFTIKYLIVKSDKVVTLELWGVTESGYVLLERRSIVNVDKVKFEYTPTDTSLIGAFIIDDNGKTNTCEFKFMTIEEMNDAMAEVGGAETGALDYD